jgi:hypothetical protein
VSDSPVIHTLEDDLAVPAELEHMSARQLQRQRAIEHEAGGVYQRATRCQNRAGGGRSIQDGYASAFVADSVSVAAVACLLPGLE